MKQTKILTLSGLMLSLATALSFLPNGDVLDGNVYRQDILEIIKNYAP